MKSYIWEAANDCLTDPSDCSDERQTHVGSMTSGDRVQKATSGACAGLNSTRIHSVFSGKMTLFRGE